MALCPWRDCEAEARRNAATLAHRNEDRALTGLLDVPLLETRSEHLLRAIEQVKVSTNVYLRRIHNYALGTNWLPAPIIPKRMWPGFQFKQKRSITLDEHRAIVAREKNVERRAFYELAWHLGASQSDILVSRLLISNAWDRRVYRHRDQCKKSAPHERAFSRGHSLRS